MSPTIYRGRDAATTYEPRASVQGALAATVLADALWRTVHGLPIPAELRARPLPTIDAATTADGLEAILRGPAPRR